MNIQKHPEGEPLVCSRTAYACGLSALSSDNADADAFAHAVALEAKAIGADFALLFFSQSLMQANDLTAALQRHAPGLRYAGCSTAGEITPQGMEDGHVLAMLMPAGSFTAVTTMVENLSSSGIEIV